MKIEEDSQKIIDKFKEMRDLEKERDNIRNELKEITIKICKIQNEINDIVEFNTRRF